MYFKEIKLICKHLSVEHKLKIKKFFHSYYTLYQNELNFILSIHHQKQFIQLFYIKNFILSSQINFKNFINEKKKCFLFIKLNFHLLNLSLLIHFETGVFFLQINFCIFNSLVRFLNVISIFLFLVLTFFYLFYILDLLFKLLLYGHEFFIIFFIFLQY